ncbi:MAG: heparinase II/III family protein [Gemmatimonadota bacterium]|nr:heparinase II/III family protein [Gemmatimonadota bacterium]
MDGLGVMVGILVLCWLWPGRCAASGVSSPVYSVSPSSESLQEMQRVVAPLMATSEEELVALVPHRTGFRYVACANCRKGVRERQLDWSIEDPFRVRCRHCATVFPGPGFAENRTLRLLNPLGNEVVYPFYEDGRGARHFFRARAWWCARFYLADRARDLGQLYQSTGQRRYARRSALILDAFARYYPGFLVWTDVANAAKRVCMNPPFPRRGGKWGEWRYAEIPTQMVYAYDSIRDSGELRRLSEERGEDVSRRIVEAFFRGGIRQDAFHGLLYTNASPETYEGYAVAGRVLDDPALVHRAVRCAHGLFRRFSADGFWCQASPAYHRYTLTGLLRVLDALTGYSDPPGYLDPEDGRRFDDLDPAREFADVERCRRVLDRFRYPDGRLIPVHDTWVKFEDLKPTERSNPALFAGMGHAWLGLGEKNRQAQVHLHFSEGGHGHDHADMLNVTLYAFGEELLSDLGYTHTRYRPWTVSTLAHNTVVVDGRDQYTGGDKGPSRGRLLAFETAHDTVQWMEAGGERAYPGLAREYRRTVLLADAGEGNVYSLDVFRVRGGARHDWTIHGSADRDGWISLDAPLEPAGGHLLEGVAVRLPEFEGDRGDAEGHNVAYGFVQNVSRARVEHGVSLRLGLADSRTGLRCHIPGLTEADVYVGDAPSVRRTDENEHELDRYRMPVFLARRQGRAPHSSMFAAVYEPFEGCPFIESVRQEYADDRTIAIEVRHRGNVDHIVHRPAGSHEPLVVGDLSVKGEFGFVRERDGALVFAGLWGGEELRWKDTVVAGGGAYDLPVAGVLRKAAGDPLDGLVATGDVAGRAELEGTTAIVRFGDGSTTGCAVERVYRDARGLILVTAQDPGFSIENGGARHDYFPLRSISGPVSCRVRGAAFVSQ